MSMIQPLSGDNSVFGICLISGGISLDFAQTEAVLSSRLNHGLHGFKRIAERGSISPLPYPRHPHGPRSKLDQVLAVVRAQSDGFVLQIVQGPDHADGFALR